MSCIAARAAATLGCGNFLLLDGVGRGNSRRAGRSIDDAAAVARSLDSDLDAYAVLVARYTVRAHRAAFLLGAGDEADDVVQDAFVKAFRHLRRFRVDEPFGPWLLRIVANETRNLTRSRRRRSALAVRASGAETAEPVAASPAEEVLGAERRTELSQAVTALPERERQVVTCRYFLELSEAETAQVLGWPLGSVKSRTFRALRRLRKRLTAGQAEEVTRG